MGSKIGAILSTLFIFIAFLFASDFVMIQVNYTNLDAFSITINEKISKSGEINDELKEFVKNKIGGTITPVDVSASYEVGSFFGYYLAKEYKPIIIKNEPIEVKIKRYTVITLYK